MTVNPLLQSVVWTNNDFLHNYRDCHYLQQINTTSAPTLLIMKDSLLVSLLVKIDQVNENYQTWMRQHILIVDCSHQPGLTVSCLFRKIKILIVFMTNNIPQQIFSVERGWTLPPILMVSLSLVAVQFSSNCSYLESFTIISEMAERYRRSSAQGRFT